MHDANEILDALRSSATPPAEALARVDADLRDAYWKAKDLRRVVALGKAGIAYAVQHAAGTGDRETLLQHAKTLAYNIGSFTWPGWDEPGIVIEPDDLAFGHACAQQNLQLAIDLKRSAERVADAHWLVGAHHLARREWSAAIDAFERAAGLHATPLAQGYVLLARLCSGDVSAENEWTAHLDELAHRSDKDAAFSREQLMTARAVFR